MASRDFQSHDKGHADDQPALIELQSFKARTKYTRVPSDYDQTRLLAPFDSNGEHFIESSSNATLNTPGLTSKLRDTFSRDDGWKYGRIGSSIATVRKSFGGWRQAVIAAAVVTGTVLVTNTIFTIVVMIKYGAEDGVGVIYAGDCKVVSRWDTALHLLINVLGTCLLAASSFTMQCLSSPTRTETDVAHAKKKTLDIGIPSFKNLFHMKSWKALLWWGLALSTVPLHLLWNSTVFSTLGAHEFASYIVNEDFLTGASFQELNTTRCSYLTRSDTPSAASFYEAYHKGHYGAQITPSDCVRLYSATFLTDRRNLIAVTKATTGMRMAPGCAFAPQKENLTYFYSPADLYTYSGSYLSYPQPLWNGSSVLGYHAGGTNQDLSWLCDAYPETQYKRCDRERAEKLLKNNGTWYLQPADDYSVRSSALQSFPIEYCYSETGVEATCQLQFVSYILYVVIVCNVIKLICMASAAWLLWDMNEPIFATVGDAVVSYMERPDTTTMGWCHMDLPMVQEWRKAQPGTYAAQETYNRPLKRKLFAATSKTRWWTTITLCTLYLVLGIVLLFLALGQVESFYTVSQTFKLGMGAIDENAILGTDASSGTSLITGILIANSFQFALSTTYFLYNSLYTAQCGALEWSSYANNEGKRKALRVTWPRGQQRSTYYLQLPYKYGLPLTAFLMLMHFLISQSIFLARVQWYDQDGSMDNSSYISSVGFSPVAILISVCVGALLIITQILHSFRPLNNTIPIHGNSSVVISALCHTGTGTYENDRGVMFYHPEENMALRTVMWGATVQPKDETEIGHCSFTAGAVEQPIAGRRYQ